MCDAKDHGKRDQTETDTAREQENLETNHKEFETSEQAKTQTQRTNDSLEEHRNNEGRGEIRTEENGLGSELGRFVGGGCPERSTSVNLIERLRASLLLIATLRANSRCRSELALASELQVQV